jgi:hypothetical protein
MLLVVVERYGSPLRKGQLLLLLRCAVVVGLACTAIETKCGNPAPTPHDKKIQKKLRNFSFFLQKFKMRLIFSKQTKTAYCRRSARADYMA